MNSGEIDEGGANKAAIDDINDGRQNQIVVRQVSISITSSSRTIERSSAARGPCSTFNPFAPPGISWVAIFYLYCLSRPPIQ